MGDRVYLAIDLKSFYASVECVERGLDPMTTNLVVADESRTEKTICLAVSPSLKSYGIPGRPRLFEVVQRVEQINRERARRSPCGYLTETSYDNPELRAFPKLRLGYITAVPRMALYMQYSARIYEIYLRYIAPEDIHNYSIDEVFIDATSYLRTYGLSARELARKLIMEVWEATGITATAGVGSNLYLCKVAMDIGAKHIPADEYGVRIAELDELGYRQTLWEHRPLTDFWRVGPGYAKKLEANGLYTMGDIARCSVGKPGEYYSEELLYRLFGVNAELLIDHAWGWEPCTIADIKAYKPEAKSVGSGQVLSCPYEADKARLVVREMADQLSLELFEKGLVTDRLVLTVGYDRENLTDSVRRAAVTGEVKPDRYGRSVPKHAHGTQALPAYTSSTARILDAATELFDRIVNDKLLVRRLYLVAGRVLPEQDAPKDDAEQLSLFTDYDRKAQEDEKQAQALARERRRQRAVVEIKQKYGKNAILRGMNLEEGATAKSRNAQIGGHRA